MSAYNWLIFDADGTLFDYDAAEMSAFTATLSQYGNAYSEAVHQAYITINAQLWQEFENGQVSSQRLRVQRFEEFTAHLALDIDATTMSRDYLGHLGDHHTLLPGALKIIEQLAPHFGLAIATNGIAEVQHSRFSASALRAYFSTMVISDEVGAAKPDQRFFEALFAAIGNPPKHEVLMIGDGLSSDIAGGNAYGIDTCWFNPERMRNPDGTQPTYEIEALADLLKKPLKGCGLALNNAGGI